MTTDATSKDNSTDWRNEEFLREKYHGEGLTISQIAEEVGMSYRGVYHWMDKFDIERRSRSYKSEYADADYKDKDVLKKLYHDEGLTLQEVGDRIGTDRRTVLYWMDKFGIERRDRMEAWKDAWMKDRARLRTTKQGYEVWRDNAQDMRGEHTVQVHRLLAVAEHGFEALDGMVVHHKNNCSWDNRPSNLEILTNSEHMTLHNNDFTPSEEPR